MAEEAVAVAARAGDPTTTGIGCLGRQGLAKGPKESRLASSVGCIP